MRPPLKRHSKYAPDMSLYTYEYGSYYLRSPSGNIELMTDQVALAFDTESYTLLKHGSPEYCTKYAVDVYKRSNGALPVSVVTLPKGLDPEKINHVRACSGAIPALLEELGAMSHQDYLKISQ